MMKKSKKWATKTDFVHLEPQKILKKQFFDCWIDKVHNKQNIFWVNICFDFFIVA